MAYLVRWWLAAELIGLLTLPLTFRMLRGLPDRGYAFARLFGILIITYLLWLGGTSGLLPYSAGSAVLAVLLLGAAGAVLFLRHRAELLAWLSASRAYVIGVEVAFIAIMLLVALLRSYQPAIQSTEKPFEFANLNAVHRTENFAQTDPWMSGKPDAYYYLGYVTVDGIAKLTGTPTNYAFNIGLILIAGLSAVAVFGLAANVAALLRPARGIAAEWPIAAGLLAVVLLLIIGNLEGVLEMGAAHGWDPAWVYNHLGIKGLIARPSHDWWPDEAGFGSWWRATRLGSDWNFLEFPFFSFLLGDLHPHVLALPFMLLAAGFGLGIAAAPELPEVGRRFAGWPLLAGSALVLGAFIGMHPWDFPPLAVLIAALLAWRVWKRSRNREAQAAQPLISPEALAWKPIDGLVAAALVFLIAAVMVSGRLTYWFAAPLIIALAIALIWRLEPRLRLTAAVAGGVVVAAALLFLPFLLTQQSNSIKGIRPTEVHFGLAAVDSPTAWYLPFPHFLLFWTPLMLPSLVFVLWSLARRGWQPLARNGGTMLALVAVLPIAWVFAVLLDHGAHGLGLELGARGDGWLTVVALGLMLVVTLSAIWGEVQEGLDTPEDAARVFLLVSIAVSVLLVFGPELFYVRDSSGTRANSTFKLWYCSWALLSVAGSAGGLWALWQWRPTSEFSAYGRRLTAGLGVAVLAGALVYPLYASFSRTSGFQFAQATGYKGSPTLDGLDFLRHTNPDELGAAAWLNQNVPDVETIVEWVGGSYSDGGRIASRTGLPTVLDWPFHEQQQRGANDPQIGRRQQDVQTIYQTQSVSDAFRLLSIYGVKYVVVGLPERQNYGVGAAGAAGLAKFAQIGTAVYQTPGVTIYRIGAAPLFAGVP